MPALSPDYFPDCDAWRAIIAESLLAFARANWMDVIDLLHAWEYGGIAKNRAGGFQLFGSKPPAAMPSGF
jgi:hypothetical protein